MWEAQYGHIYAFSPMKKWEQVSHIPVGLGIWLCFLTMQIWVQMSECLPLRRKTRTEILASDSNTAGIWWCKSMDGKEVEVGVACVYTNTRFSRNEYKNKVEWKKLQQKAL